MNGQASIAMKSKSHYRRLGKALVLFVLMICWLPAMAQGQIELVQINENPEGGSSLTLTIQVLLLMTVLTLLPSILLMFTSFTRIIIVFAILRQALGAGTTPSTQVLIGLALFLSFFIMMPVIQQIQVDAYEPYIQESIELDEALRLAVAPVHEFMRNQVRQSDLAMFASLAGLEGGFEAPEDIPLQILVPAFLTSELKTAFQIGFLIFIPFVIIDLAVASVLMSMGMIMLSPMLVSLPFKLMLFVLVDGWALLSGTLASSFLGAG